MNLKTIPFLPWILASVGKANKQTKNKSTSNMMKSFKSINPMFQKNHRTCASFNHIELLSSKSRHYAYQRWLSHFSWHCHCRFNMSKFISSMLCNSRICCLGCSSSQGKELLQLTSHWSIPPLTNWGIQLLTQT